MKKIILQLSLILLSTQLFAQTTIENFSYGTATGTAADSILNPAFGGASWRKHSGTLGAPLYRTPSLVYTGYASSGIGGSLGFTFSSSNTIDVNRSTASFNSGSVYVSFLLNITNSGGTGGTDAYFFHVMDTAAITAFRGRHYIRNGSVANTFNIGLGKSATSSPAYSSVDYPLNTPILVVMKYKFDPLNPDSVTEYIFTSGVPLTEPTTPTMIAPDITAADLAFLNAVAVRQHPTGSSMAGIIDGIRVSNSWANSPLPVELTKFKAEINKDNNTTQLTWTTASEFDNMGFDIERSIDGNDFETIGFVKGAGNSNKTLNYTFEYANIQSAFYRLKQIDFDGKTEYSSIIAVTNDEVETTFSPNPFNNQIELTTNVGLINNVEIIDMMGKVVLSETINNTNAKLNSSTLLNGVYLIKIYQGETVVTKRILKSN